MPESMHEKKYKLMNTEAKYKQVINAGKYNLKKKEIYKKK